MNASMKRIVCSPTAKSVVCVPDTHRQDNAKVWLRPCECQHRLRFQGNTRAAGNGTEKTSLCTVVLGTQVCICIHIT